MELIKDLTAEIIKKHIELQHHQLGSLELAISIGEMLNQTKEESKHGQFTIWVQANLPFSIRTAQKYMSIFAKKDLFHKLSADELNRAYLLISPVGEEDKDVHIHKNPTFTGENGELIDVTPDGEHSQVSYRDYWDHLGPLLEKMDSVHKRLIGERNSTTPDALGHMFGNIHDMANVLRTWDPEKLENCSLCGGLGCGVCIDGKIGLYKESEF